MDDLVLQIEHATVTAWRARESEDREGWVLQADDGVTGRVNACAPLGWRGDDPEAAIDRAEAWYRARGLVPQFRLCDGAVTPADLAKRLAARRYQPHTPTLLMTRALEALPQPDAVALSPEADDAFFAVFAASGGSAADLAERRGIVARSPAPKTHAIASLDGAPVAIGLSIVTQSMAGVMAMRTLEAARRRGLARRIVLALLNWARAQGATHAYLQVEEANAPAIALYEQIGFTPLSRYLYWRAP